MLKQGVSGEAVRALQQNLLSLGYDLGSSGADGDFGQHTAEAVMAFQRDHGLTPDGIVGPRTSAALAAALTQPAEPPPAGQLAPPNGLSEIRAVFGDIGLVVGPDPGEACYLRIEGDWVAQNLVSTVVEVIPTLHRVYCHKKIVPALAAVFADIVAAGLAGAVHSFDGCFCPRYKRRTQRNLPSVHSWGIALDLNAATNRQGTKGDMHPGLVAIFRKHGFKWGGDWSGASRDPMHFQYCTGY
jgi:peptidoglycan hydrolase-like protein with peptidoglycan-binding domain